MLKVQSRWDLFRLSFFSVSLHQRVKVYWDLVLTTKPLTIPRTWVHQPQTLQFFSIVILLKIILIIKSKKLFSCPLWWNVNLVKIRQISIHNLQSRMTFTVECVVWWIFRKQRSSGEHRILELIHFIFLLTLNFLLEYSCQHELWDQLCCSRLLLCGYRARDSPGGTEGTCESKRRE